jgi:hypothetical protein
MTRTPLSLHRRFALFALFLTAATVFALAEARAKDPAPGSAPSASLIQYDVPGGETVFALSLRAGPLPAAGEHDYAILFDTSASQAGAHRRQGLAVLDACLKKFSKADRVRLFAVDLRATPLMDGFFPPQSDEAQAAVARLQRIVPLGATDLKQALESGLKAFSGKRARSIVYIGDGMSSAHLVQLPDLRKLLSDLRQAQVPVTSFAVGPRTDLQLLGTVAYHTGGVVLVDALMMEDSKVLPEHVGEVLASAAAAPVFYPEQINLTPDVEKLLPELVPPIRADRDTIFLGKERITETLSVSVSGAGRKLEWSVKPAARQSGNTFLVRLWEMAEQTDGLAIAMAGQELLEVAREEFEEQVRQLVVEGRRAVAVRDLKAAEQIAQMIRLFDPANVEAETIMNAVQKSKAAAAALARRQKTGAAKPEDDETPVPKGQSGKSRATKLRNSVLLAIDLARQDGESDPQAALKSLQRIRTTVESATELDQAVRDDLLGKVKAAVAELKGEK